MRVEFRVTASVMANGDIFVTGVALLYESTGGSHGGSDLDGRNSFSKLVPLDNFADVRDFVVYNDDEGGDSGTITITFSNTDV
jgi:hypothetical protein